MVVPCIYPGEEAYTPCIHPQGGIYTLYTPLREATYLPGTPQGGYILLLVPFREAYTS